jgi:hypothetical protein
MRLLQAKSGCQLHTAKVFGKRKYVKRQKWLASGARATMITRQEETSRRPADRAHGQARRSSRGDRNCLTKAPSPRPLRYRPA